MEDESMEVVSREDELTEDLYREDKSMEARTNKIAEIITIAPQQQYALVALLRTLLDQVYHLYAFITISGK